MSTNTATIARGIIPLHRDVLVTGMIFGEQETKGGIIISDDDKKDSGIHPRWAEVYAVGPENCSDLVPGNWILISHGRWTREFVIKHPDTGELTSLRKVDPKDILIKTEEKPYNTCIVGDL